MPPQAVFGISVVSVSNSWSGGDGELDKIPAMGDPAHMI